MKALLSKAYGIADSLVLEDVVCPTPGNGEILIDVHMAGVNFPGTLLIEGKYQIKPPFPFAPRSEAAGVVVTVRAGVSHFHPGDKVIALTEWGCFAEQVVVQAKNVMPIPASMEFAGAAGFGVTYGTSMHALCQRTRLQKGETLLVLGASRCGAGCRQDREGNGGTRHCCRQHQPQETRPTTGSCSRGTRKASCVHWFHSAIH